MKSGTHIKTHKAAASKSKTNPHPSKKVEKARPLAPASTPLTKTHHTTFKCPNRIPQLHATKQRSLDRCVGRCGCPGFSIVLHADFTVNDATEYGEEFGGLLQTHIPESVENLNTFGHSSIL